MRKGTTQVMYIAKIKDGPKRVMKTFSMILERVLEVVWWRGRKWNHIKKDFLSWSIFPLSKYWLLLLFKETLGSFLFPFLSFLYALSLEDSGVLMIFEEKITSLKTYFEMAWHGMAWSWLWMDIPAVDAYSGMELCTPIWLNHDYGDGGVVNISMVAAYFGVEVCMPIFLGKVSK
jgi:hypothetical protein